MKAGEIFVLMRLYIDGINYLDTQECIFATWEEFIRHDRRLTTASKELANTAREIYESS